jgi:hypothetical protein
MPDQEEFFTPEEVDQQIERVSQLQQGDRADAELIGYVRGFYGTDAHQKQEALDRIWNRIALTTSSRQDQQEYERELYMQDVQPQYSTMDSSRPPQRRRRATLMQRLGVLAAAIFLVALVGSLAVVFYAASHPNGGTGSPHPHPTPHVTPAPVHQASPTPIATLAPSPTPSPSPVPLQVTSVTMSVSPASIAGIPCGTNVTVTYTAIFHVAPKSAGGTVRFMYTVNNGRGSTPASINFSPGETTRTYTFTWSGALPVDHTYPEPGGVQVQSPNQLTSQLVVPTGRCV